MDGEFGIDVLYRITEALLVRGCNLLLDELVYQSSIVDTDKDSHLA